jgi:hypothetical protein
MNAIRKLLLAALLCAVSIGLTCPAAEPDAERAAQLQRFAAHVQRFARYNPQEKVWLHFDNTAYYAGDTVWFKAYVRSTLPDDTARHSRTLYVDLVAPSGRVVLTRKLRIDRGQCHGDFPLLQHERSDARQVRTLPAGFYEVRAYTRTMLNQGTEALFSRVFPVYDHPAFAGDYTLTMSPVKEVFPDLRPEVATDRDLQVDFYPEGGASVVGLPGRVAYRLTDRLGNPVDTTVYFHTPDGTDYPLHTLHDGMGLLSYTPSADGAAYLSLGGRTHYPLPEPEPSGYVLSVDNRHSSAFNLIVRASADQPERTLGVAVQHEGNLCYYDTLRVAGGGSVVRRFDSAAFPTGVCQLTLFDTGGIVADRLLFISAGSDVADTDLQLSLTPEGPLRPDSVGRLRVSARRPDGSACPATLSVAIRDAALAAARPAIEDPRVALLLSSEVRGYIHRPDYYFATDDAARRQALDLLLMVQGWRRYDWSQMSASDATTLPYYREEGLILNGYVFNRRGRRPIADQVVHITMRGPHRAKTLQGECRTDSTGNFNFLFGDLYGRWELAIHLDEGTHRPHEMQYRLDRVLRPAPRAYAAAEVRPYVPPTTVPDSLRYTSLDQERLLSTVEVETPRRRDIGFHVSLDVDREAAQLLDEGRFCPDVETFLDEMNVGFTVNTDIDTAWLYHPDTSATEMPVSFREQSYLWGEKAVVTCYDWQRTSFRDQRWRRAARDWPLQLPIQEIHAIDLYDKAYLRAHPEFLQKHYSDSLVMKLLEAESGELVTLDQVEEEAMRQRRDVPNALVVVQPKPLSEQRTAPKNYRLTNFDGYYVPKVFHADYRLRSPSGEDVRRTLYWNPDVATDSLGQASVTFRMNSSDHSVAFSVVAAPDDVAALPRGCTVVVGTQRE